MASNQTYKAFSVRPSYVLDLNGVLLDSAPLMAELAAEVRGISAYATYVARNDTKLPDELFTKKSQGNIWGFWRVIPQEVTG